MEKYSLLSGKEVDLTMFDERERRFLDDLLAMGKSGVSYFEVYRMAIGPGSIALQGRNQVNHRILSSELYQLARDIATRIGIDQGRILAPEHEAERDNLPRDFKMVSVAQAAELIGITRAAVYKAIKTNKLRAHKIGNVTVVDKAAAVAFRQRRKMAEPGKQPSGTSAAGTGASTKHTTTMAARSE